MKDKYLEFLLMANPDRPLRKAPKWLQELVMADLRKQAGIK